MTNRFFMELRNHKWTALQILLLIGVSLVLRLAQLGYSNLQGDEILTLCRVSDFQSIGEFLGYLLGQRKGPVQYIITCAFSLFDPTFSSELAVRLPFAIANLLAVACFFVLVYRLFTLPIAIYASFLFAVNGIFIAFARIVQYQSFVILGGLVGILALTLALKYEKWKVPGLYLGFLAAALSLLAHFDAAFFLPPMAVFVLHWWLKFRGEPGFARLRIHLFAAVALFAVLVLAFYAVYFLRLTAFQLNYWEDRRVGDSTNIFRLFQFYNPGPMLWLCLGWAVLGLTRIRASLSWQILLAWILPPMIFMVLIFQDSRTHAYTYLLPLLIVAGIGVDAMLGWLPARLRGKTLQIAQAAVLGVFLIFSYISYEIFIDRSPEYPWYPKPVLGMQFDGGFVSGTFGFPYSREWREIGRWFEELPEQEVLLVTNEKRQFVEFYLPPKVRNRLRYVTDNVPKNVRAPDGLYILMVRAPQSWTYQLWGLNLDQWRETFVPVHEFVNDEGEVVASVYFLRPDQIEMEFD
jgi:4-amino-4-deoxy-L-arabinose transferase-like glycosyltransferase